MDNVFTERLWRSVKYEQVSLHDYQMPREAKEGISKYLSFSTQERPHQSLDYRTPAKAYYEGRNQKTTPIGALSTAN